jgi:hypothetical protein
VPVRGAQSFVGVMTAVWKRPSLAGLEIAWRWLVGVLVLTLYALLVAVEHVLGLGVMVSSQLSSDLAAVQAATVFQPVAAVHTLVVAWNDLILPVWSLWRWLLLALFVVWNVVAALGRAAVLRRLNRGLQARRFSLLVLGTLRAGLLAVVWGGWVWGVKLAVRISITGPAARQVEPSIVLFCAMLIVGSLALYVLWGAVSWPFYLAPLLSMQLRLGPAAALRAAFGSGAVRGKLIEINMVMNIVRIALIVLAMVFSASPLPFSSVETQTFLNCWWTGVGLVYLGMSDYFHVVRSAAYLLLWRAYNFPDPGDARAA